MCLHVCVSACMRVCVCVCVCVYLGVRLTEAQSEAASQQSKCHWSATQPGTRGRPEIQVTAAESTGRRQGHITSALQGNTTPASQ